MLAVNVPIREIGYDASHTKLTIRFEHGEARIYVGVPHEAWRGLCEADSPAAYFGERIEDCYPYNILDA